MTRIATSSLALCALAVALVAVPGAQAHGGTRSSGYVSSFSSLDPQVLGVLVNVFGSHNTIQLSNYSGEPVVVMGREGEPYLRFTRAGVAENRRSPTTFLNRSAAVPVQANPDAKPVWQKVANGNGFAWHDHRIVWTGADEPPVVKQEPDVSHLIFRWSLPATADGKPFRIEGFLGWAPPPKAPHSRASASVYAAVVAGVLLVAAAAAVVAVRARCARRRAL